MIWSDDSIIILLLLGVINLLILFSWAIKKFFPIMPTFIPRKFLHVTAISVAALSFILIKSQTYLIVLGLLILGGNYFLVKRKVFEEKNEKNYGVFFVPVSYLLLTVFFNEHRDISMVSMLITAFSDGMAALFGQTFNLLPYSAGKSKKTILGSFVFLTITVMIFCLTLPAINEANWFWQRYSYFDTLIYGLYFGLILTLIEALSYNGFDNLLIPFFSALLFSVFFLSGSTFVSQQLLWAIFLVSLIMIVSLKAKFLTTDGVIAAAVVGLIIFGLGGLKWAVPLLVFFFASSALSRLKKVPNEHFEKGDQRDAMQVFANGALPSVILLLSFFRNDEFFYLLYLTSLAVSTADTWATEIGNLYYQKTVSILNFRETEQGVSGGVSLLGSSGALLGALVIMASGIYWVSEELLGVAFLVVVFGFFGMTVDSLLGALWQRKNICVVCGKITEKTIHCNKQTKFHSGLKPLNNDMVNFISELFSTLLFYLIYTTALL